MAHRCRLEPGFTRLFDEPAKPEVEAGNGRQQNQSAHRDQPLLICRVSRFTLLAPRLAEIFQGAASTGRIHGNRAQQVTQLLGAARVKRAICPVCQSRDLFECSLRRPDRCPS